MLALDAPACYKAVTPSWDGRQYLIMKTRCSIPDITQNVQSLLNMIYGLLEPAPSIRPNVLNHPMPVWIDVEP
jgi:hypothetical protein